MISNPYDECPVQSEPFCASLTYSSIKVCVMHKIRTDINRAKKFTFLHFILTLYLDLDYLCTDISK